eukprot:15139868-Ditylum_brightwellii.AAC.1
MIGLYALTKKVHNLYLGGSAWEKMAFLWFLNSGDVPDNHEIDRNSFAHVKFKNFKMIMNQTRFYLI